MSQATDRLPGDPTQEEIERMKIELRAKPLVPRPCSPIVRVNGII